MNRSYLITKLTTVSDGVFFIPLVIYHLLFLMQGIDFADEGFHLTFYQQIFTNPESMEANFMYWFTGIVGGSFYYLFPNLGMFGLRIQGAMVIFSTMLIVYYLLKEYINLLYLRLGILIIVFFTANEIKEMHYDTLAALLNVSSAFFLFKGLKDNKGVKIALSGAFISLSMFTRTPSIVLLVFFIAIIYYGLTIKLNFRYILRQIFIFFCGFVFMTIVILLFMKLIGHLSLYIETLKMGFGWVESSDDSHNIFRLLKLFIIDYSQSLKFGALVLILIFILHSINNFRYRLNILNTKIYRGIFNAVAILFFIYLVISHHITYTIVIFIFTGISLISTVLMLSNPKYKIEVKLLAFLGCLILFFEPLGSAWGLSTAGKHSLWIIFPIAIDYIFNIKTIDGKLKILGHGQGQEFSIATSHDQLEIFKKYFIGFSVFVCVYYSYYYPYFDMSDRIKMTSTIENKYTRGIFTTKERATAINELLEVSARYIKKNDFVLAYDCIPMFHFLTETKPYIPCTWPWLFLPNEFKKALEISRNKSNELPVIISQKVNTLGTNWPQNYNDKILRTDSELMRDSIFNNFVNSNGYKKVWENIAFEIRVPPKNVINTYDVSLQ